MNTRELELTLAAADPVDRERLDGVDLEAMETELLADLDGEQPAYPAPALGAGRPSRRPRRFTLAIAFAAGAAAAAVVVVLVAGSSSHSSRAYGAELVRFAESTPLLLLEGPGWRVQDVFQQGGGEGHPPEGSMEFVTGKPIPYWSTTVTGSNRRQRVSGMPPPALRQRKVELRWSHGSLAETLAAARRLPHPHGQRWVEAAVLDTTAQVDTRAEFYVNQGGPGNRQMTAYWSEDGYLLEMRAAVPDQAAFEERLDWLARVDPQTWLEAMPARVVKSADHGAAVGEMLRGVPVPADFDPGMIPDEGVTTNRYQVGAAVTGVVSCLWFRQWGEARRDGDRAAKVEAERAMATSKGWPILREMARDGAFPAVVWQLAAAMPSGEWRRGWRLLPHAEALGCARKGIPVLPWKQKRQDERAEAAS